MTFVFYDGEEVEAERNGLAGSAADPPGAARRRLRGPARADRRRRSRAAATGTLRVERHHPRRGGALGPRLDGAQRHPRGRARARPAARRTSRATVEVDGLVYREGLNAVGIRGGIAGNVIPDALRGHASTTGSRPTSDAAGAERHVRELFDGLRRDGRRRAPAAPGRACDLPAAAAFVAAVGAAPSAKYGWTDVARFSALGIPAVNFGPGDPEPGPRRRRARPGGASCVACEAALLTWLLTADGPERPYSRTGCGWSPHR